MSTPWLCPVLQVPSNLVSVSGGGSHGAPMNAACGGYGGALPPHTWRYSGQKFQNLAIKSSSGNRNIAPHCAQRNLQPRPDAAYCNGCGNQAWVERCHDWWSPQYAADDLAVPSLMCREQSEIPAMSLQSLGRYQGLFLRGSADIPAQ